MPNWCNNSIQVAGSKEFIDALAAAATAGGFCNFIKPVPAALLETTAGSHGDPVQQAALELQEAANIDAHGYKNWYDFCVAEWGTKWDVGNEDSYIEVTKDSVAEDKWYLNFSFDSAWAPPIEIYEAIAEAGHEIEAYYYEPGMAFCGKFSNDGGDEYYEITGNSDWVVANIPEDVDVAMGISEDMASWEEMETDDAVAAESDKTE
jgi:hypothetical protein